MHKCEKASEVTDERERYLGSTTWDREMGRGQVVRGGWRKQRVCTREGGRKWEGPEVKSDWARSWRNKRLQQQ